MPDPTQNPQSTQPANPWQVVGQTPITPSAPGSNQSTNSNPWQVVGQTPSQPTEPSFGDKVEEGLKQSGIAETVRSAIAPPSSPEEEVAYATGGPVALETYRAGRTVVGSVQSIIKAPRENYQLAKKDFVRAVQDFHKKDYRNLGSDVMSLSSDMAGMNPANPRELSGRMRELSEGARPGGNLTTPVTKGLADVATIAAGEYAPEISDAVKNAPGTIAEVARNAVEKTKSLASKAKEKVYPTVPEKPTLQPDPTKLVHGESEPVLPQKPADAEPALPNEPEQVPFGKTEPILPEKPAPVPQTPRPAVAHTEIESPFDDATIRKLGGGKLSADARNTLRQHVGDTFEAGSSDEIHLLHSVKPVNETITNLGGKLNEVLNNAPDLNESAMKTVQSNIHDLQMEIPGGLEKGFNKAITKELTRYSDTLNSVNPREINEGIRDLDERIDNYRAPEDIRNASGPGEAADAARVVMRRALRDKLNTEIPETAPLNAQIAPNMEIRALLRKKFGDVAKNPEAAEAQYTSELQKGKQQISNKAAQTAQDEQFKADTERAKAEHAGAQDAAKKAIDERNATAKAKYDQEVSQIKEETAQRNKAAKENYQKEVDRLNAEHAAGETLGKQKVAETNKANQEATDKANAKTQEQYEKAKKSAEIKRGAVKAIAGVGVGAAADAVFGGHLGIALGALRVLKSAYDIGKAGKNVSQETPSLPIGYAHIRDSKGVEYTLPSKSLEAAKEHDPGLQVLRTA